MTLTALVGHRDGAFDGRRPVMMTEAQNRRWEILLRSAAWGGGAVLYAIPVVAELVWTEMAWSRGDFVAWAIMLLVALGGFELSMRASRDWAYRFGGFIALGAAFLLVWVNLAVGVIGSEGNAANLMYGGVLAIGLLGAAVARGRARGLAVTLVVMALATVVAGVSALVAGWGAGTEPNWSKAVIGSTLFWGTAWLVSAALFRHAARRAAAAAD